MTSISNVQLEIAARRRFAVRSLIRMAAARGGASPSMVNEMEGVAMDAMDRGSSAGKSLSAAYECLHKKASAQQNF